MVNKLLIGGGIVCLAASTEVAIASYFIKRTLIRGNAKVERTEKMAGTDWSKYIPVIKEKRKWLEKQKRERVYITSDDGLKLTGLLFPNERSKRVVICFHGYTSKGINDYVAISRFYYEQGFNILLVDQRAHGDSEGKYIGFGCLDRMDAAKWIDFIVNRYGEDCEILLHGTSMGGATVLMTSGLQLPKNVKMIISDCAFTSAWEVFSEVLKNMYHMPPYPIINIGSSISKRLAGYELDQCNSAEEVKKSRIPILFIHGDSDTFVPCRMCHEIYENCASEKDILIVKGAGHAESYYKETSLYEEKISNFINKYFKKLGEKAYAK